QQRYAIAEKQFSEAIPLLEAAQDDLHLAEALTRRGNLSVHQGHDQAALAGFAEAIHQVESIRSRLNAPTTRADYRTTIDYVYRAPLSLYLAQGDFEAAFNIAERARSRVLADLLTNQDLSVEIPASLQELWHSIHRELDQAYANRSDRERINELERKLADLDRQIEFYDQSYVGLTGTEPMRAADVCPQLSEDAALLTYVSDNQDRLWVLVLTKHEVWGRLIPQLNVQWLQTFLSEHIDGIHRGKLIPSGNGYLSQPKGLIPPLFEKLLAPACERLQAKQTVYIVPHGPLYSIPIGALTPTLSTPAPLLAAGRRVVYAPSATILFRAGRQSPLPASTDTLAVAPNDERLQYTIGAAKRIVANPGDLSMTGTHATKQAFLAQAGRYRMICFLGHARFDPVHPMSSRLMLSDGHLRASELSRGLRLHADLVILAACETGRNKILLGDELLGLPRALLHAGIPAVLVTLWPVHEVPTRLLVEEFIKQRQHTPAADAARTLAAVQNWLRTLTFEQAWLLLSNWDELTAEQAHQQLATIWRMTSGDAPPQRDAALFDHPYFWSPFILIGSR
ncbi:MAG: CHAT domain-containing protein, partial [Caldilineaceae bacterium]|nr:CHAT domain-containing protein [Caldilineaceae bacterium]